MISYKDIPIIIIGSIFLLILVILLVELLIWIFKSPFQYPYKKIVFDISKKRNPKKEDLIDQYIIENGLSPFSDHFMYVEKWKNICKAKIENGKLKNRRRKQYLASLDDAHMFQFCLERSQTRYRQRNYVKFAYKTKVVVSEFSKDYSYIKRRFDALNAIHFECTLSEYYAKDQRKKMTKALRSEIAKRDNFTCQICGKYMPDGVGLHIDHIIPIAKGGKSVPSNLQVLCSKCNGKKSNTYKDGSKVSDYNS